MPSSYDRAFKQDIRRGGVLSLSPDRNKIYLLLTIYYFYFCCSKFVLVSKLYKLLL